MNTKEIVRALRCCNASNQNCDECTATPIGSYECENIRGIAADLIEHLINAHDFEKSARMDLARLCREKQEEIERLKLEMDMATSDIEIALKGCTDFSFCWLCKRRVGNSITCKSPTKCDEIACWKGLKEKDHEDETQMP